ncbi:MAG: MFS transporter [Tepidisphaeraceae bacterium]
MVPGQTDPPAYEPPDNERAASASPTEPQLEAELHVAGRGGHDPYLALRNRNYGVFAMAFLMSVIGGQMQTVAVGWEIYSRTGSALSLGWVGLALALPVFLLALPAGHVADTHSRRRIMMGTHVVSVLCALGLAWLSFNWPHSRHSLYVMYALLFVGNAGATFGRPARSAYMPQIVPIGAFANAVTWNSSIFEMASVVGPALGGLACSKSVTLTYLLVAACWAGTIVLIWQLPNRPAPRRGAPATMSDLAAGVRYVWRSKLMLGTMTLDLFAVLLGGVTFLLPIFALKLGAGASGYGWLRAAPSIGAICTAILIAHSRPLRRAGRTLLLCVAGFGLATIVFGLSQNYWLSFAMLVVTGAFDNVSVVVRHTLVQLLTPDAMRGRVSAVNQIFIGSSNELGGLESGLTAAAFGEVWSVVGGGIGTILVVLGVSAIWPEIRKLGSLHDVRAEEFEPSPAPRGFEVVPVPTPRR